MQRKLLAGVATIASVLALSSTFLMAQDKSSVATGAYKIDPAHSYAIFRITHLGVGANYGAFEKLGGTFEQTDDGLKVEATIDVESINTFNEARDKHLKGPDFFNAKQFPQMTFKSTAAKKNETGYEVTGDLTIKGTTKSITVDLKKVGEGKGMQGEARVGYETMFTINRLDYGITWNPGAVGNDVAITVAFEATK
jgi:polyisoprenoid-binding protein YceI